MRNKRLWVNGVVQDEPYVKWGDPGQDQEDPNMMWQREHLLPWVDRDRYHPTRDTLGAIGRFPRETNSCWGTTGNFSYDSRYWGLLERWEAGGEGDVLLLLLRARLTDAVRVPPRDSLGPDW